MIKEGKYLINIIGSVINNEKLEGLVDDIDYSKLIKIAKFHSVECLLYQGIIKNNIQIPNNLLDYLHKTNLKEIYKDSTQEYEKKLIAEELEKNKIKHTFLKGCIIKYMYPEPYLRSMADIDILVELSKFKYLKKIMTLFDYKAEYVGGNHDVFFKEPFMNIEMHRRMIDESYKLSKYYKNIWEKFKKIVDKEYEFYLTDEDYYIYMIAHTAKHFSNGGTGIRSILDIWVYLKNKENTLDWDYIINEFEKLDILNFSNNIKELSKIWFNNNQSNELYEMISDYIVSSGTYGISINLRVVQGFINSNSSLGTAKFKYIFSNIFLSYKKMKRLYPILKILPILLPLFWSVRLVKKLLFKRKDIKNLYNDISDIDSEKIENLKYLHEKSGI